MAWSRSLKNYLLLTISLLYCFFRCCFEISFFFCFMSDQLLRTKKFAGLSSPSLTLSVFGFGMVLMTAFCFIFLVFCVSSPSISSLWIFSSFLPCLVSYSFARSISCFFLSAAFSSNRMPKLSADWVTFYLTSCCTVGSYVPSASSYRPSCCVVRRMRWPSSCNFESVLSASLSMCV